jgi:predicted acetyltransferase
VASSSRFGPLDVRRDLDDVSRLLGWSFAFPPEDTRGWFEKSGLENVRVLRDGKVPVAALLYIPMGQFFGGRRVPTVGLAGVGVAPERRGTGVATEMCKATVRELHRQRVALSTLYPSTQKLYRGAGWEIAGGRWEVKIAPSLIRVRDTAASLREMAPKDRPKVMELYRSRAALRNGELDRGPYMWSRVFEPRGRSPRCFLVEHRGALEGYAVLYQATREPPHSDVVALDVTATTARAARRILSLFAEHKTLADSVTWRGGPSDVLLHLLPERGYEVRLRDPWMLRICHVPQALEARGYGAAVAGELHLAVEDDVVPANSGKWMVRIQGGKATVEKGGRGRLRLDARALAALYTGHMTAEALAVTGALAGPADDLARATALFAGATPAMTDAF